MLPLLLAAGLVYAAGCMTARRAPHVRNYVPDDRALYDTVMRLDSLFFAAYNTCDVHLDEYAAFYSDDIEFYHDGGGLSTSKADIVESTKRNVCGKVTREPVKGSTEVYPIRGFGAVEVGYHRFRNREENSVSRPGRFVIVWHKTEGRWLVTRVVSLH